MSKITRDIPVESLLSKQMGLWEVQRHLRKNEKPDDLERQPWLQGYVTISRLLGSSGNKIALRVAELLDFQVFGRELVHFISVSSKVRSQVIESLDGKRQSEVQRWVQGIMDSDILSSASYLKHLMRVILTIAEHGRAIIIGRGANYILDSTRGVRVKIYAPEKWRVRRIQEREQVSEKAALKMIRESDNQRLAFIRKYFHRDADDPAGYDLIINTADICPELAAHLIKETLTNKYRTLSGLQKGRAKSE